MKNFNKKQLLIIAGAAVSAVSLVAVAAVSITKSVEHHRKCTDLQETFIAEYYEGVEFGERYRQLKDKFNNIDANSENFFISMIQLGQIATAQEEYEQDWNEFEARNLVNRNQFKAVCGEKWQKDALKAIKSVSK